MVPPPVELRLARSDATFFLVYQTVMSGVLVVAARSLAKRFVPVPAFVDGLTLVLGLLAVVGLVLGARLFFSMKLRMDEQGLTLLTLRGYTSVRFEDIRELYPVVQDAFQLVTTDGRRLKASVFNHPEVDSVWEALVARIRPRLLTEYERRLAAGDSFQLGPLRIDRNGLEQKEQRLSWSELEEAVADEASLRFFRRGEQRAALFVDGNVPNGFLLQELWQRRTASRSSEPRAVAKAPPSALGPVDPELGALIEERMPFSMSGWVVGVAGVALIAASLVGPLQSGYPLVWVLIGLACLYYTWSVRGRGFQLYTQGVRTPRGAIRFDALEHVSFKRSGTVVNFIRSTVYETLSCKLIGAGRTVRLEAVEKLRVDERAPAIWDELERRMVEPLVRKRLEELRRGGHWVVGELAIDATRLGSTNGEFVLPLEEAEQVRVLYSSYIAVWRKGAAGDEDEPWATFNTGLQDAVVVRPLIEALRSGNASANTGT